MLRDRCARLEQELKTTQGALAVLKSKQPRPAEREAFLLEELEKANTELLCKCHEPPSVFCCTASSSSINCILACSSGVRQDAQAEASRVSNRLRHIAEFVGRDTTSFWSDPARGRVLALLQDRVSQVTSFAGACRSALALVYKSLFPMDPQPQGLSALMARFRNGEAAQEFIRSQLVSGAVYALAFVRRRHPYLVLTGIEDVPLREDGQPTPMDHHYRAVEDVAIRLIGKLEHDTEVSADYDMLRVPKGEPVD